MSSSFIAYHRLSAAAGRSWRASATRRLLSRYRRGWVRQPIRHVGTTTLTAVAIHLLGHLGDPALRHTWGWYVGFAVMGGAALGNDEDWEAVKRQSRVVRWWTRTRRVVDDQEPPEPPAADRQAGVGRLSPRDSEIRCAV